jgi:hypothetical protein
VTGSRLAGDAIEFAVVSHDSSLLPQRHLRRLVESGPILRPKRVSHDREKNPDEDWRPERRDELRRNIMDC